MGGSAGRAERTPISLTVVLSRGRWHGQLPQGGSWSKPRLRDRTYLTRPEFVERYGATPSDVEAVRRWAEQRGLRVGSVDRARRSVSVEGLLPALEQALSFESRTVEIAGRSYREPSRAWGPPDELRSTVAGIFGLTNRPMLRPHFRLNPRTAASGYSIPTVGEAYGFPASATGRGVCVGLLEFGGGYRSADLASYFEGLGRPVPSVTSVGVDGAQNDPTGDPRGPDAEVELDIEMAGALAPDASIVAYFAPNTEQGFVDALTTAIHDEMHHPSVVSISWGGPEPTWSPSARTALEGAAQDAAALGVTILAASGDQGATDGEPAGTLAVDFPASSPYVLGCGGTRLTLSGAKVASEVVWDDLSAGEGATGGGVSEDFPLPSYQSAASVPAAPNGFVGRGVPDVAADADPETGYAVVVDGAPAVIGGTSAAAPLWAALLARLEQALGRPMGYANPILYAPSSANGLRAITSGGNGGYSAHAGWNPCAGLGSPKGGTLLAALQE